MELLLFNFNRASAHYPVFTCRRRANEEQHLQLTWQEFCSGNMGMFITSSPFMGIAIYDDFMVIGFINPNVIPYK